MIKTFFYRRLITFMVFLALLSSGLVSCDKREEGKQLADAGVQASEKIAEFYDTLVQDSIDALEFQAFFGAQFGIDISDDVLKKYEQGINSLRARAALARSLAETYRSLKKLSDYNAGEEVNQAATDLSTAIKDIPVIPASGVDPSGLIGNLAEDIARWKQGKDIKKGSILLRTVLVKVKALMVAESVAYASIGRDRREQALTVIKELIKQEKVASLPLIKRAADSLGLKLIEPEKAVKDDATKKALVQVADTIIRRQILATSALSDQTKTVIDELIESHNALERGSVNLATLIAAITRAQSYIDEIKRLRTTAEE